MLNKVKEKLAKKGTAVGSWMSILKEDISSSIGNSELDWVLDDLEPGPASIETARASPSDGGSNTASS